MKEFKLHLLGSFKLEIDGKIIKLPSRHARFLLAILALNPGQMMSRERIAGQLWPESSGDKARASLRQTLWHLRQRIQEAGAEPDLVIDADREKIGFIAPDRWWVDANALHEDTGTTHSLDDRIKRVQLYRGELLPGVYDEWVNPYRSSLSAKFDRQIEELIEDLADNERWEQVLSMTDYWLSISGPTETVYRAAMIAHSALGDAAAAVSAYQDCLDALENELGVPPSLETVELYERLRRGDRLAEPPGKDPSELETAEEWTEILDQIPSTSGLFVAREWELRRLRNSLEQVIGGRGTVLFVEGASGSGKTALAQEFISTAVAESESVVAAIGTCEASIGPADPFAPFREILALLAGDLRVNPIRGTVNRENARRLLDTRPHFQAAINRYGPDLMPGFFRNPNLGIHGGERPPVTFGSGVIGQAVRCLLAVAEIRPLILFVDDLQWADSGTLTLFFQLGRRLESSPMLLLGAFRPEALDYAEEFSPHPLRPVISELIRLHGAGLLDLDELSKTEGRQFIDEFLDSEPNRLDDDFRQALFEKTAGHPLFTVELLRSMEADGSLIKAEDGSWIPGYPLEWGKLPPRIEAALKGRIERLHPDYLSLLEVAAVEGGTFTAEVISKVRGLPLKETISYLSGPLQRERRLVLAEGVRRMNGNTVSTYRFRHDMIHAFMYEQVDKVERIHFHGAVAEALEEVYSGHREEIVVRLARHYKLARLREKAVRAYLAAGRLSGALSAHQEAVENIYKGLEVLSADSDLSANSSLELELHLVLGPALIAGRGYADAAVEGVFQRARKLGEDVGSDREAFAARWGLWGFYTVRAKHQLAQKMAKDMHQISNRVPNPDFQLTAHRSSGSTFFYQGKFAEALAELRQAKSLIHRGREHGLVDLFGQDPEVDTLIYLSLTEWFLGKQLDAQAHMGEAVDLAKIRKHPYSEAFALTLQATLGYLERNPALIYRSGQAAARLAEERGFPFWLAASKVMTGWARSLLGEVDQGLEEARQGVEGWKQTGAELVLPTYLSIVGELELLAGYWGEAEQTLSKGLEVAARAKEMVSVSELHRIRAEVLHRTGEVKLAREDLLRAIDIATQQGALITRLRAALDLARLEIQHGGKSRWESELQVARSALGDSCEMDELVEAEELLREM